MQGQVVDSVEFLIDKNKQSEQTQLGIKFSGIDEKDIGQVVVYSMPNELITVTNYQYVNDMCYVTLKPNMSTSYAKLVVSHLSSNKTASINLKIDQKSSDLTLLHSNYIVSIPDDGEDNYEHIIEAKKLVNLLPAGSTDKVYFKLAPEALSVSGVTPIYEVIDDEESDLIKGFNVAPGISEGEIKVYPVARLNDEQDEYLNKVISVKFIKTLKEVSLTTDEYHQTSNDGLFTSSEDSPVYLIANDKSVAVTDVYSYNNFKLGFEDKNKEAITKYLSYYNIEVASSNKEISAIVIDENVVIQANAYTENVETVSISFVPKGYVGDISTIMLNVYVKGEVRSDEIEVKLKGELQEKNNIDIYDYYSSGNSLGAKFNFKPVSKGGIGVYEDLSGLVISIDPRILYSNNNIYDNKFEAIDSRENFPFGADSLTLSSQKYLIEIYKYSELLKFYYDESLGLMISEPFSDLSSVYIKYQEVEDNTQYDVELKIELQTTNVSSLSYLAGITPTKRIISFERKEGVVSLDIHAGVRNETDNKFVHFKDDSDNLISVDAIYLDVNKGVDNTDVYQNVLYFDSDALMGAKKKITNIELNVELRGIEEAKNLGLSLTKYESNWEENGTEDKQFTYTYNYATVESTGNLFIGFNSKTAIGQYQIVFSQPATDFEKIINVYVYKSLTEDDITANVETNLKAFKNDNYTEGYDCDYIVASGQALGINISLPDAILNSNIVKSYNFVSKIEGVLDSDLLKYFEVLQDDATNPYALMKFNKGTYIEENNKYVELTISVKTQTYLNIITQNATPETTAKTIKFFIYEEIKYSDLSLNQYYLVRYMNEYLGVLNKSESVADIQVLLKDKTDWKLQDSYINSVEAFIDGNSEPIKAEDFDGQYKVDEAGLHNWKLTFKRHSESYTREISAVIKQFNNTFTLKCEIVVKKPIITERLIITSDIQFKTENGVEKYVINLKKGDPYTVKATNISSEGAVSHSGIVIQVVDKNYSAVQTKVHIDKNIDTITVLNVEAGMKLIVFAKDALKYEPVNDVLGYDDPAGFMMEDEYVPKRYKNAYVVIDLDLSDGATRETAYQIYDANDFWEIKNSPELKKAKYALMTDINLLSTTYEGDKFIDNFEGEIFSYADNVYTIYNFKLDEVNPNLFNNLMGNAILENIRFDIDFAYSYSQEANTSTNLGLIDVNNGTIKNVFISISGESKLENADAEYYFGGLVGENCGNIYFTNAAPEKYVGTSGGITLNGNGNVKFGGLVGKNIGIIDGFNVENSEENNISVALENVVANLTITSNLTWANSSIGQVVGYNENIVQDIYATGSISGLNNLGGVIGENSFSASNVTVKLTSDEISNIDDSGVEYKLQNLVSNVKIKGTNYIGGIVGKDTNGTYLNCAYQAFSAIESSLSGTNYIGGIAGYSNAGKFKFVSVFSYAWDYNKLSSTFNNGEADISGVEYVGGLIGYAVSATGTLQPTNEVNNRVIILNSSVNAKVSATNNIGGLLTDKDLGISIAYNVYFIGQLYSDNVWYEEILIEEVPYKRSLTNSNAKVKANIVYTANVEKDGTIVESSFKDKHYLTNKYNESNIFNWLENIISPNWGWDYDLNGKYIYVTQGEFVYELYEYVDGATWEEDKANLYYLNEGTYTSAGEYDSAVQYYKKVNNYFYKEYGTVAEEVYVENSSKLFVYDETNKVYDSATDWVIDTVYYIKVYKPIFDVAPTEISVKIQNEDFKLNDNVLMLNYYDFKLSTLNKETLEDLNGKYNTYQIQGVEGLFTIETNPKGINPRLLVSSSNNSVVRATANGRIVVEGVGQCVLTFSSMLNPNVFDEIIVNVSLPVGDYVLSKNADESVSVENETVGVAKGTSKQLFVLTSGFKEHEGENYSYATKESTKLKVEVSVDDTDILNGQDIDYYISISGQEGELIDDKYTVILDEKTPLSLNVKNNLEDTSKVFNISVMPYETISCSEQIKNTVKNNEIIFGDVDKNLLNDTIEFNLQTAVGPTDISANISSAVIYPNDSTILKLTIKTDIDLQEDDFDLIGTSNQLSTLFKLDGNLNAGIIKFNKLYSRENGEQVVEYVVSFDENIVNEDGKSILTAEFTLLNNGEKATIEYTLLKQRINKIEIKNYVKKDGVWELDNVLKPASKTATNGGKLIIDMAPDNGYYDYLEIRDITGNEEIKFIQVDSDGNAYSALDKVTADKKGIQLKKDGLRTYVSTQIAGSYSSKVHTVEVRAYLDGGYELSRNVYYIDVKMLPSITVDYMLPNNKIQISATDEAKHNQYLANGTEAQFNISTKNANGKLEYEVEMMNGTDKITNYYELKHEVNDIYVLKLKDSVNKVDSYLGATLTVKFRISAVADNGDYELTEASIQFKLVDFMIHSFSIVGAIDDIISGTTGTTENIEVYFAGKDVSFSGVDRTATKLETDDLPTNLNNILTTINNNPSGYLKLNAGEITQGDYKLIDEWIINEGLTNETTYFLDDNKVAKTLNLIGTESDIVELSGNQLLFKEEIEKQLYLAIDIKLKLENHVWIVAGGDTQFTKNFELNFNDATSLFKPKLVATAEDFLAIESGENNHYILGDDIELYDYSPINVKIGSFDGNGRTITIKNFASFNENTISAGLFKQIYEGMLVKNVNVQYEENTRVNGEYPFGQVNSGIIREFADLCNNKDIIYTSAVFGGLTPNNQGIVTNCTVRGTIALHCSTIEQKSSSYSIDFSIGGLIGENSGFVTNSDSKLNIYAQANIGGFVVENSGKIASCSYGGVIYTYNNSLSTTIVSRVAGFAIENSGEISMSCVELSSSQTMSAKDVSAGFIYDNKGNIEDCYAVIPKMGVNNNTFCGFVYLNGGTIETSYTSINNGDKNNNNDYMFAPTSTTGILNCIEINNNAGNASYSSGIDGLTSMAGAKRTVREEFEKFGFAFGDNSTAVWRTFATTSPKLVSVEDKVKYTSDEDPEPDKSKYYGLQTIVLTESTEEGFDYEYITNPGNYGSKSNPYIIYDLLTWNYYFNSDNTTAYYRIVADIDFGSIGDNPSTSSLTFKGNIQGNNMFLSNILLKSSSSLNSIGLFKEFVSANNVGVENSVRNLTLSVSSVWATKTSSVGVLAGISESFNLYNIHIDSSDKIMVGGNAVGGIAGVIRGKFDMQKVSSNIGVNSTVAINRYKYEVYASKNNLRYENASLNLSGVYYSGSIAGILDAYDSSSFELSTTRDIATDYYLVRNVKVNGRIVAIGDSVGAAFGFVGERVMVKDVEVNIANALLSGGQYSAGVAGENRGLIINASVVIEGDEVFNDSTYVSAGVVGLNLGGLVQNVAVKANILKSGRQTVVGGIVGRNMNGNVNNAKFDGQLLAGFVGGIIGGNYSNYTIFTSNPSGSGALTGSYLAETIPNNTITFKNNSEEIANYQELSISKQTLDHFLQNIMQYYAYKDSNSFDSAINRYYVYGLCVGLIDSESNIITTRGFDNDLNMVFNGTCTNIANNRTENVDRQFKVQNSQLVVATEEEVADEDIKTFGITNSAGTENLYDYVSTYSLPSELSGYVVIVYTTGAKVESFDTWSRDSYGNDMIMFGA